LEVAIIKRLYQKSFSFPSFIPLLFEYRISWVIASPTGSAIAGDLHSTTTRGKPFTKRTMSGMMCFSVPGIFTLNWEIAIKELFSVFLKSMYLTVGLLSPVFLFSATEVFSKSKSWISLFDSRREFAVGVVILLTTSFIWSSSIQGFIFFIESFNTSSRITSLKLSLNFMLSPYLGSKDGLKEAISFISSGLSLFCL